MRTTLTLDEDVARQLRRLVRSGRRSFKEVVNTLIRRGLSAGEPVVGAEARERFVVRPKACGFRSGIDPLKLNQLVDELETKGKIERP